MFYLGPRGAVLSHRRPSIPPGPRPHLGLVSSAHAVPTPPCSWLPAALSRSQHLPTKPTVRRSGGVGRSVATQPHPPPPPLAAHSKTLLPHTHSIHSPFHILLEHDTPFNAHVAPPPPRADTKTGVGVASWAAPPPNLRPRASPPSTPTPFNASRVHMCTASPSAHYLLSDVSVPKFREIATPRLDLVR
jgi:hypothetical protein